MTDTELLPCPFCGPSQNENEELIFTSSTDVIDGFDHHFSISCPKCGIEVYDEYRSEVVEIWNTRTITALTPDHTTTALEQIKQEVRGDRLQGIIDDAYRMCLDGNRAGLLGLLAGARTVRTTVSEPKETN